MKINTKGILWTQWAAAAELFIIQMMSGITIGWISPLIGKLSKPNPPFQSTPDQISWVASLIYLFHPIGVIIGTIITRYFGSKNSIMFSGVCFLTAWITLEFSYTIEIVYFTYIFSGIGMGAVQTASPVFISEIASPKIRGNLMSLAIQGALLGILLGNVMGTHLEPWVMVSVLILPTVFFLCTFVWFSQSPYFYIIRHKNLEQAKKALEWYNPNRDVTDELQDLIDLINSTPKTTLVEALVMFKKPVNRNTLLVMITLFTIVPLNGFLTILDYMEILFIDAEISIISPEHLVTIVSILSLITSWISVLITEKIGRVTLLMSTFIMTSLTLFSWGSKYFLLDLGHEHHMLDWIVIISAIIYRMSVVIGFCTVGPIIMSEIFAPDVKNFAISFCNISHSICAFISIKTFQILLDNMSHQYVFYLFASVTLVLTVYCKVLIPETRGKSLTNIQIMVRERFGGKSDSNNDLNKVNNDKCNVSTSDNSNELTYTLEIPYKL